MALLLKTQFHCDTCNKQREGFQIPDGRLICCGCSPQAVVDQAARDAAREASASVVLLRAELSGDLRAIRQQQDQMSETLKELRDEARRGRR